jgi:plastocyanin
VPVPSSSAPAVVAACKALTASLPDELDKGVRRRTVATDATRTAAWGDPPVTLQCGVPLPDQTKEPLVVDGLAFVTVKAGDHVLWTTRDRAVNVTLDLPTTYEQAYLVQALVPALSKLPAAQAAPGA